MTDKQKAEEIASKIIARDEPLTYTTLIVAMLEMACYKDSELLKKYQKEVKELSDSLLQREYPMCP